MKYVFLLHPDGTEFPVFCLAPTSHRELAAPHVAAGCRPVSAGYLRVHAGGSITTGDESITLGLKPRPEDARLLTALYTATLSMVPTLTNS
jgi:hypothetical protein